MKKSLFILFAFVLGLASLASAQDGTWTEEQETIWNSKDEAYLISVIEKAGEEPKDIFMKNLACKRLAVIGTDASIPALAAMLPSEKLNFNARTALEAMPTAAADQALIDALGALEGKQLVGVLNTLAMRSSAAAVAPIKDVLAKTSDPDVKKAAFIALGYIATSESIDALMAELKKDKDPNFAVNAALADSLMNAAETCVLADDSAKAIAIYDAVAAYDFPLFSKKGAVYNGLLTRKAGAVDLLKERLLSEKDCCFNVGLKTVREFAAEDGEAIVKMTIDTFPQIKDERKPLVARALGDRKDDASKALAFPFLVSLVENESGCLQIAAVKGLGKAGNFDPAKTCEVLQNTLKKAENPDPELYSAIIDAFDALPEGSVNEELAKFSADEYAALSKDVQKTEIKILELLRVEKASPELVKIAQAQNVDPEVCDSAVSALSEIVSLENLNLLIDVLNDETLAKMKDLTDADNKSKTAEERADWYLRAAVTRLPQEACAAKIADLYNSADLEGKFQLLNILKQVGGKTALAAIEKACWVDDTADKATEVLGQWNTPEDASQLAAACLKLAKESKSNKYKVRGIKSYIRIPRQFDLKSVQRIKMAKVAFNTATRPEEKAMIFEIFKRITEIQSVQAAMSYAEDPEYSEMAYEAAVYVAERVQGVQPEIQTEMKKVIEKTTSDDLKARAQRVLDRK